MKSYLLHQPPSDTQLNCKPYGLDLLASIIRGSFFENK